MRIRKHAKRNPLLYATSSLKAGALVQTHVCQLNQSPWDVMTFSPPSSPPPPPPPPFQANGCGVGGGNGSSGHCISVLERELTPRRQSEYSGGKPKVEAAAPPPPEAIIMCCKTDGKSWQCRREAAAGNSLCEHHLSLVRSYNSVAHHATKRSVKPPPPPPAAESAEAPRRTRPKKAPDASSSDPRDYYYYTGFGPQWGGGRRGENRRYSSSNMPKNEEEEEEEEEAAAASRIGIDDFDFEEFEDEEEEEEEAMSRDNNGKKRMRKPIKARSLKSFL